MVLARSHGDPLLKLIILVAIFVYWLIKSAFGKEEQQKKSLPSFAFSELESQPRPNIRTIYTKIRGVSFQNDNGTSRQEIIRTSCHPGDALLLIGDRKNPVDPNAIKVIRICHGADRKAALGEHLGYLSKEIAADLAIVCKKGLLGFAEILEVTGDLTGQEGGYVGVDIRAEIFMPKDRATSKRKVPRLTRSYKGEGVA